MTRLRTSTRRSREEGTPRGTLLLAAFAAILLAAAPRPAAAQAPSSGIIAGVVLDQEDRQPLPNSRVGIYAVENADSGWTLLRGGLTGADGAFRFEVPPGTYRVIFSYQSYSVNVRDDVLVAPGGATDLTVTLTPKPIEMKAIEVKGTEARGSEASSLANQKKAEFVSDAITAEQISKSTDANAAEALQRVTGLSVVDGRYVFVRGLGERYSSTTVNGASVGTPEPNKRVVPLDVFPSGALDEIVVQKTYTPDQEGEFAGGVINLNTREFTEGTAFTQSLSTGYSAHSLDRKFLTYRGGALDFLGFDDGARDYPDLVKSLAGSQRIAVKGVFGGPGFSAEDVQAMGRSFNRTWSPNGTGGRPNYSYAASFGHGFRVFGKPIGFLGSLSLSNGFSSTTRANNAYTGSGKDLSPNYLYRVEESNARVLGGAIANLSFRPWNGQAIRLRSLYTRSSDDATRIMQGPNYDYGTDLVRITSLDFVERGLLSSVLSGEHHLTPLGDVIASWHLSYSEAMRDEPDRRESIYESDGLGGLKLSLRNQLPLTRVFGDMNEFDRGAGFDLLKPVTLFGGREGKLKAGVATRHRNRVSSFRRLGFALGIAGRSTLDLSLPPESLLVPENIQPGYFQLNEETRENDTWHAAQDIGAWYGMAEIPVLPSLRLVGGARIETSDQAVEAKSPFVTTATATNVRLKHTDVLPAANATLRLAEQMNVRGGFSVTLSRPELREMSPFDIYDYETGYSEQGNVDIKSSRIENYDVRWELYPAPRELLAVSLFRKTLYQPIENIVLSASGGYNLQPRNGRDGRLRGFELELRAGLPRIWNALARVLPIAETDGALERWGVSVNYSRVSSNVRVRASTDAAGNPIFREGPLEGQSTFSANAGVYYGTRDLQASLQVAAFGKRLAQVGAGQYPNPLPDIYEFPATALDFTSAVKISGSTQLKLAAENLLNKGSRFREAAELTRSSNPGRSVSISLSLKK